jgi:hypothetical protein
MSSYLLRLALAPLVAVAVSQPRAVAGPAHHPAPKPSLRSLHIAAVSRSQGPNPNAQVTVTVTGYVALWAVITVSPPQRALLTWINTCYYQDGGSTETDNYSVPGVRLFSPNPIIVSLPKGPPAPSDNCSVLVDVATGLRPLPPFTGRVVVKVAWTGRGGAACQGDAFWTYGKLTCI